jgi:hypothetical protein
VRLQPDEANAGGVIVIGAGPAGPVSGAAIVSAQAYILARAPITDYVTVENATASIVTAGGVVTVAAARLASVKAQAQAAWLLYLSTTSIGGYVVLSRMIQIVMDAGAIDFADESLNGDLADLPLGPTEVPVPTAGGLVSDLTWLGL